MGKDTSKMHLRLTEEPQEQFAFYTFSLAILQVKS